MSHTYAAAYFHCVFSTKGRRNAIPDGIRPTLWAYFIGIAKNLEIVPVAIGGTSNHAHLLLRLKPTMNLAETVQKMRANSSRWLGEQGLTFEWQQGYAAFTVSPSRVQSVKYYVLNQDGHHRKRTFEEELLSLLRKLGVAHDAKDVFAP